MQQLVVDDRWNGEHGIGRFSTEVVKRLSLNWSRLKGTSSPTDVLDILSWGRIRLSKRDVVFTPGFNAGWTRAVQLLVVHDLIHLHVAEESSTLKTLFYNSVVRPAILRAGVVMTVSEASAHSIAAWLQAPSVDIVVVGNGRSAAFSRSGPAHERARNTYIYVGNLKPHKNVDVLLSALRMRPDYDLVLVTGDVALANAKVVELGLTGQVEVRSKVSDEELAGMYRGATGALQPSLLEGFGLPALEAMSCGTAVAYWDGCESVREICAGTGVAVKTADSPEDWALAMDALAVISSDGGLSMPDTWDAKYDWDAVARNVQRVVERAQSKAALSSNRLRS
jgi:glycosyltransferase involved in cell wall biosynthesis